MKAAGGYVECQLTDGYGDASDALVTDAQDAFIVRADDHRCLSGRCGREHLVDVLDVFGGDM